MNESIVRSFLTSLQDSINTTGMEFAPAVHTWYIPILHNLATRASG